MELLTKALDSYGISGFLTVALVGICAIGVKMAINVFNKTTNATLETNKKLLAVNHEISTNSIHAVNSLALMFKEFSINDSFNHKEVVKNMDTNHKEVVKELGEIKKKILELQRK